MSVVAESVNKRDIEIIYLHIYFLVSRVANRDGSTCKKL